MSDHPVVEALKRVIEGEMDRFFYDADKYQSLHISTEQTYTNKLSVADFQTLEAAIPLAEQLVEENERLRESDRICSEGWASSERELNSLASQVSTLRAQNTAMKAVVEAGIRTVRAKRNGVANVEALRTALSQLQKEEKRT